MSEIENIIFSDAAAVQYHFNSQWSDCEIEASGSDGDCRYFLCRIPSDANGTVDGIRLVKEDNTVIGSTDVTFVKKGGQTLAFKVRFKIREKE